MLNSNEIRKDININVNYLKTHYEKHIAKNKNVNSDVWRIIWLVAQSGKWPGSVSTEICLWFVKQQQGALAAAAVRDCVVFVELLQVPNQ